MPVSGGASAFFPPTMPSFWNAAAFMQQQQQQQANYGAAFGNGACLSSPTLPPMYNNGAMYNNINQMQMQAAMHAARNGLAQLPGFGGQHSVCISPTNIIQQQLQSPTFQQQPICGSPSPPAPRQEDPGVGVGVLVWLSSQAGLIKKVEAGKNTTSDVKISFQLKDFCDQAVTDLTCVLRPGFFLRYQATSQDSHGQSWVANFVSPVHYSLRDGPLHIPSDMTANLEGTPGVETGPPQLPKDPYNVELEALAVPMLLGIFERNGVTQCQLSSFHSQISNCGEEPLYRYIGTSSLKRRQYLERRTHLFHISSSDMVSLQPAAMYTTVLTLVQHLLKRGGACLMQDLFDHFNSCPDIPLEAREMIGDGKTKFVRFLDAHTWLFAVFPSRVFVAARRQLPQFDYAAFINEHFDDQDLSAPKEGTPSPKSTPSTPSFPPGPPGPPGPPVMEPLPPQNAPVNNAFNWQNMNDMQKNGRAPVTNQPPPPMWPINNDVFPPLTRHLANGTGAIGQEVQSRVKMIRRSTEVETQTEGSMWMARPSHVSNWASPPKGPLMVDAGVQVTPLMVSSSCGTGENEGLTDSECSPSKATLSSLSGDTSSLSAPDSCKDSLEATTSTRKDWNPWSPPLCQVSRNINVHSFVGTDWSGNSLGEGGFDPFYSPLSLMHNLKLDK